MKIICNKDEFADMIRACLINHVEGRCMDCVFSCVCTMGEGCEDDDAAMRCIEDICEIEVPNG